MKKLLVIILLFATHSCKERYEAPVTNLRSGYLVVEGFINSGIGPTTITLSRSTALPDRQRIKETGALVQVEGDNNSIVMLAPNALTGIYTNPQLTLSAGVKYRLKIRTSDNKEYVSEFQTIKTTPVIDSITWKREPSGVDIYVNAHDAQNNTRYYKWEYEQTWEFHSKYSTYLKYKITNRPPPAPPLFGLELYDSASGSAND
ncbi:MAG: DUF4249 domain-containing protein, partial [Gemmatimonadaceae bacterium]|nr:DUF4249 domain-containing protein [Chitinophagaceae bacterium]